LAGPLAAASISLSLTPVSTPVDIGSDVEILVGIGGFVHPTALGVYDLTVQYNAALFSFGSITFGDPLPSEDQLYLSEFTPIESDSPGTGTIEFSETSLDSPAALDTLQATTFLLATLQFQAIGQGTGTFSFDAPDVILGDAIGNPLSASLGTAQVQVESMGPPSGPPSNPPSGPASAPEPYMFLPCLAVLAALHFRNRSRSGVSKVRV
jgi:hypothetical protein